MTIMVSEMIFSLKNYFRNLSIYDSDSDVNPERRDHENRSGIIATRIFFLVLIISLIILILSFQLNLRTRTVTIHNPSKEQFENLSFNAHCPCSRISIPYDEFNTMQVRFHQVCSSDFVSDRWMKAIFTGSNATYFYILDFRVYGSAAFQALASFCRLSKTNVLQSMISFNKNPLISSEVLSRSVFLSQVNASVNQFQLIVPNEFKTQLNLIREIATRSKLQSGLQTNFYFHYSVRSSQHISVTKTTVGYKKANGSYCSCADDINCKGSSIIFDVYGQPTQISYTTGSKVLKHIDGFKGACLPMNSILLSTLECFYNQICLNQLISFFPIKEKFLAMTITEQSRFKINSTVKMIVDELMIEEWVTNISYDKYYAQCAPHFCTYSINEKYDFVFMLTELISLLGGLTLVLSFFIRLIVRFARRLPTTESITLSKRIRNKFKRIVTSRNMFKSYKSNDRQQKHQRIATYLYIFILLITSIILTFYILLIEETHHITIIEPSEFEYKKLEEKYSDKLQCPCSSISINYSSFINTYPQYHQLCSSDLISPQWIDYNRNDIKGIDYLYTDYRFNSQSHFQLLAMFCQQSHEIVKDGIEIFLQTQFVSSQIDSSNLFESKSKLLISDFQLRILKRFLRTIKIVQALMQGNLLMNAGLNVNTYTTNSTFKDIKMKIRIYSNCSCALSSSCMQVMNIYNMNPSNSLPDIFFSLPNFFIGCSPIESLFKSTLQVFYNQSSMLEIDKYSYNSLGSSFYFSPLNSNLNFPNETIESIVNRLMMDSWRSNVSFSSYYKTCAPLSCTFEYIGRNNLLNVITYIISIISGLSTGLKIFFLIFLRCIENLINSNISFLALKTSLKNVFISLNNQQMTNRLQLFFLLLTLYCIFIFSAVPSKLLIIEIIKPTFSTYQDLSKDYSQSLQCFCSHISIPYNSFLDIKPRFHDLCLSEFISEDWINYLYGEGELVFRYQPKDFRSSAVGQFELLSSLCQLSQETVNDNLIQLLTNNYIDRELLSKKQLNDLSQTVVNQSELITSDSFLNILNLIRESIGANMIISGWSINWLFFNESIIHDRWTAHTIPIDYQGGCNCGLSWKCTQSSRGMMAGCYPIEALLRTTLQCFYDQNCIDANRKFKQLNISSLEKSRYQINSTIESILNNLMIEEYQMNKSYENYYNECAPSLCQYTYVKKYDLIEGILSIISIYSGLVILTRCFAVILIKLYLYQTNTVTPETTE